MSTSRNSSPTRNDATAADKRQLGGYNITIDKGIKLAVELAKLVKALKQSRDQEPSPHAQAITEQWRYASDNSESLAQLVLEEHILFRGESEARTSGVKYLTIQKQVNLVKDYLPKPPYATIPALFGALARPQPDSCIGYITADNAGKYHPELATPFTREEDSIADCRGINVVHNAPTHFPFLTAQWKSGQTGECQIQASVQAARNGALIVNYMHQFYLLAYPNRAPTPLETCHFSMTTECYTIILWIHWREVNPMDGQVYFRMEEVEMARMRKLDDVLEVRKILKNYIDFAMGERLRSIKKALPAFWPNRHNIKAIIKSRNSTARSTSEPQLDMPMTPSDTGNLDEVAPKKMKRTRE
ncbi:hypothetical protein EJ04DRAFT_577407 [Polyplosphaeria fusca]|uniref:DUF7924 domain-containing protein n=1 Tax=Polyplosphaeria fusca TaxID=682080 RepID=A0A9P4QZ34_9PLEO|nr:hypothetical protein EJ04DRAFT_577407 [Polyplosphaeria fusca]